MGHFRFTDAENIPVTFMLRPSSGTYRTHFFSSSKNSHRFTIGMVLVGIQTVGEGLPGQIGFILTVTGKKLAQDSHDPE